MRLSQMQSCPQNTCWEARTKATSGSWMEAEKEALGIKPRPGPEAETEQLDLVVATEPEFEEVLAISGGIYGGLDYLPSCYHIWLQDPNLTVVLAEHTREVSVHLIDAKKTALVERLRLVPRGRGKGVACLLPHSGVKVARTFRDDQQGPRELKKYRLNTKQVGLGLELVKDYMEQYLLEATFEVPTI